MTNKKQKNIPKGWKNRYLESMFDIKRGGSPRPIDKYLTKDKDGLNWLMIGDIDKGAKYITKTSKKIIKEGAKKTTLVKKGDFILSNSMSFGRPYILDIDTCIHDGWLTFQNIKTDILNRNYLYYLLLSSKTQAEFLSVSAGSGVQNLKKETVSEISLLFPPPPEQKQIVKILEIWDEYLEKLSREIEIKKNIKKGLMQRLLSGDVRSSGFSGEWKSVKLGDITEIKKGQELSKGKLSNNGEHRCLLYGEIYTKYNEVVDNVVSRTNYNEGIKSVKNDVLIPASTTTSAMDLATATVVLEDGILLGGDINIIRDKENNFNGIFLSYYLTHIKKHALARLAQGITIVHLYGKDFKKIKIELPSIEEQTAIADIIVTANQEIKILEKKKKIIEDQRRFLLNNLVTGKIRVPEYNNVKK